MKRFILLLSWALAIPVLLASCDASDNYYMIPETADTKATKMEAIGTLFESIARQPEMADNLIAAAEQTLYRNYRELLPLSDKAVEQRGAARGAAIGSLIESVARQPEMYEQLDEVAEKFLGQYDSSYITKKMNDYAKAAASTKIIESIARQPDLLAQFDALTQKYLDTRLQQIDNE